MQRGMQRGKQRRISVSRCRVNMAHLRQASPGFQFEANETFGNHVVHTVNYRSLCKGQLALMELSFSYFLVHTWPLYTLIMQAINDARGLYLECVECLVSDGEGGREAHNLRLRLLQRLLDAGQLLSNGGHALR